MLHLWCTSFEEILSKGSAPADNKAVAQQPPYGTPYIVPGYGYQPVPYPLMYQMPGRPPGAIYYQLPPDVTPDDEEPNINAVWITAAPTGSYQDTGSANVSNTKEATLWTLAAVVPTAVQSDIIDIKVNGVPANMILDTGSTPNLIL